jgi:hypothetical protein
MDTYLAFPPHSPSLSLTFGTIDVPHIFELVNSPGVLEKIGGIMAIGMEKE